MALIEQESDIFDIVVVKELLERLPLSVSIWGERDILHTNSTSYALWEELQEKIESFKDSDNLSVLLRLTGMITLSVPKNLKERL